MTIQYPHTIENGHGEILTFDTVEHEPDGDRVVGENWVNPGFGPPMHTHFLQDEGFTVVSGKIGYQVLGGPEQFAGPGETAIFKRGVPHRFWNAGDEVLHCKAWVKPADNFVYFISAIFNAQKKSGKAQPDIFDAAFLLTRYKSEFDMLEIPAFVKKVIFPIVVFFGKRLGKYKHFADAPEPVKA